MMQSRRKLIYGVGINDGPTGNYTCPIYRRWKDVLRRCFSYEFHSKNPTYTECRVCEEWLLFSNFKKWMEAQDWKGKQLDKDILVPGNKLYCPNNCAFVDQRINSLLTDHGRARGRLPQGVDLHKPSGKFRASCNDGRGCQKYLGLFDTISDARLAYVKYKASIIIEASKGQADNIREALRCYADRMVSDLEMYGTCDIERDYLEHKARHEVEL